MTKQPEERQAAAWESRLHAYLDGELAGEEARELESELLDHPEMQARLRATRAIDGWLGATRPAPPATLAASIERAIAAERAAERAADRAAARAAARGRGARLATWVRSRFALDWKSAIRLAPAPVLVAVLVILLVRHDAELRRPAPGTGAEPARATAPATMATAASGQDAAGASEMVAHAFSLAAPGAGTVCLVGDFNQWSVCDTPLARNADGSWSTSVQLPAGRHEYMFVVDGKWMTDPGAELVVDDGFGNRNAVLFL